MENQEITVTSHHARNQSINGKKIQIDYEEVLRSDGGSLIRYKTYVDNTPLPVEFTISKEVLQTFQKKHDQAIYSDIPDSILEWYKNSNKKTVARTIIQNGKPVSSYKALVYV